MPLQLTNTLTGKKEPFVPLEEGRVRMYVCGPTVYGLTHVGNARPVIFFDVVRRYLELSGFEVTFVSNFTDVDDKIINKARQEGKTSDEIAKTYTAEFLKDVESLSVRRPTAAPKVTEHIPQIIKLIEGLVANGTAYVTPDGEVLYAVRTFKEYGKLSGKNVDEQLAGVRIESDGKKRDPLDFSLWKPQKAADEPAWESPWGKGRPGWHIECSAMALTLLGETFDIHGGGLDLLHPHHENEIAQSEAFTKKPLAKYWMHNNMLNISGEKMSKSLGNIFYNRQFIQGYSAETLKFLILSSHYRSTIDFSEKHIRDSQAALHRVYTTLQKSQQLLTDGGPEQGTPTPEEKKAIDAADTFTTRWREAMDDDFNTAKVVGFIFESVRSVNSVIDKKGFKPTPGSRQLVRRFLTQMKEVSSVLNLFAEEPAAYLKKLRELVLHERGIQLESIEHLIVQRAEARAKKDFAAADAARAELLAKGVELRDSVKGTEWDIVFAG